MAPYLPHGGIPIIHPAGQGLLTHSALLSAGQKSINFPTVSKFPFLPLPCLLFLPPSLFILCWGEPRDNVKFPNLLRAAYEEPAAGGSCGPGSGFKPQRSDGAAAGAGPWSCLANQQRGEGGRAHKGCCLHRD